MVGVVRLGGEDFPVLIANTWLGEAVAAVLLANVLPAEAVVGAFVQPEGVQIWRPSSPTQKSGEMTSSWPVVCKRMVLSPWPCIVNL